MIYPKFGEGVRAIWDRDSESQNFYLSNIGEVARKLPVEAFRKFNAFFVPNDGYVATYFGVECQNLQYEMYHPDGTCNMCNYIVFPFYNLIGQVVGWVCYKPFTRLASEEKDEWGEHYYEYPSSSVFNKGKYIFTMPSIYEAAMKEGYIIITDGVFDTVSFVHCGLNACSVLGSQFNVFMAFYFRFVKQVFVSIDNDEAGMKLYRNIQRFFPNAKKIRHSGGKDSDDMLKSENRDAYLDAVKDGIVRNTDVVFRPNFVSKASLKIS